MQKRGQMKAPDKRLQVKIDELCDLLPNGHLSSTLGMEVFIDHIIEFIKSYKDKYISKDEVMKKLSDWIGPCTCSIEYTSRKRRDPQCGQCDFDLEQFADELEDK